MDHSVNIDVPMGTSVAVMGVVMNVTDQLILLQKKVTINGPAAYFARNEFILHIKWVKNYI